MTHRTALRTAAAVSLAGTGLLAAGLAQAAGYFVVAGSNMDNVRHIGGASIETINSFSPNGPLDPTDPLNWPLMTSNIGGWDPNNPTVAPPRDGNYTGISGTMNVTAGTVTAATLNQLNTLTYGTFQSYDFVNGYGVLTNLVVNGLTWTFDSVNNRLMHQAAVGLATCTPAGPNFGGSGGTSLSGQCNSLLRGAVDNSTGTSMWNWDGIGANYTLVDNAPGTGTPWHPETLQTLNVGGPYAGILWDTSLFVDGVGGVITGYAFNSLFNSGTNNATAVAAIYTLNLVPVPVPAAVWLFGGALAALGLARRRTLAAA